MQPKSLLFEELLLLQHLSGKLFQSKLSLLSIRSFKKKLVLRFSLCTKEEVRASLFMGKRGCLVLAAGTRFPVFSKQVAQLFGVLAVNLNRRLDVDVVDNTHPLSNGYIASSCVFTHEL